MSVAPGTRLGPYEILDRIGSGGMGEVYRATDTRLGRTVAIKFIDAVHAERFQREARAIAALNHPHICTLHDVGPDYLVMEHVEGKPLKGPMPPDQALRLALQIAGALEAAHRKGIVHRDLKPANILLADSGAKLLDFGLAKLQQSAEPSEFTQTQTQAGLIMGTAAYMSPEQAEGRPADARSDIFSFGLVLYELLSGRRAFYGQTAVSTMAAILHKDPDPLDAPAEFDAVIRRCLKKSPSDRFQNASELREALAALNLSAPKKRPSVAVLPFTNMSGDKENEYFSDGLAEEIISALTRLPGLKVAARTSAFAFKGRSEDIRKIGEVLAVDHVLEGSVRKSGNRIRITAQLVAIAEGSHLWSERYDRQMDDVFAIQDEISQAIVEVLKVKLAGGESRRIVTRRTANVAAYQAWMEGQYHRLQLTPAGLVEGLRHFERAIALDPEFAAPHAGIAECYLYQALYAAVSGPVVIPIALAAAERAIALDPAGPDGYMARGYIRGACEYDWTAAESDYLRALELSPDSPLTNYRLGWWVRVPQGRFAEAAVLTQRAAELDPLSTLTRGVEALTLSMAGRRQEAIDRVRSGLPSSSGSFLGPFLFGSALANCELWEEAAQTFSHGLAAQSGNIWLLTAQAMSHRVMGNTAEVRRIADQVANLPPEPRIPYLATSCLEAALGNNSAVLESLDRAVEQREIWTVCFLREPWIASLYPPGAAAAALRKMNLTPGAAASA